MNSLTQSRWYPAIVVALVMALAFGGALYALDKPIQQGDTNFDSIATTGNVSVGGNLAVTGTSALTGAPTFTGLVNANGGLAVDTSAFTVADTTGATVIAGLLSPNGGIAVDTSAFTVADTSGNTVIAGSLAANGGITSDTNKFTVADTTGNTLVAGTFAANGGITADTSAFTVADTSGNTVISGTLSANDDATLAQAIIAGSHDITPSNGSTITADYTFYQVSSAGNVTITLGITGAVAGQILILYGDDANTVKIADTNVKTSTGAAIDLGQFDVMAFMFVDNAWVELWLIANS